MDDIPDIKRELSIALNMHYIENNEEIRQKDIHKLVEGRDTPYDPTMINNVAAGRLCTREIRENIEKIVWKYLPGPVINKFVFYEPNKN